MRPPFTESRPRPRPPCTSRVKLHRKLAREIEAVGDRALAVEEDQRNEYHGTEANVPKANDEGTWGEDDLTGEEDGYGRHDMRHFTVAWKPNEICDREGPAQSKASGACRPETTVKAEASEEAVAPGGAGGTVLAGK
jgi:hypothetical protein